MNIFEHDNNAVVPVVKIRFEGVDKEYDFINEIPGIDIGDTVAVKTVSRGFQIAKVYGFASKGNIREGAYIAAVLSKDHQAKVNWLRAELKSLDISVDLAMGKVPASVKREAVAAVDSGVNEALAKFYAAKSIVAAYTEGPI